MFTLAVVLGVAGVGAAAAAIVAAVGSVHRVAASSAGVDVVGVRLSYPRLNGAEWALLTAAFLGATALSIALVAFVKQRTAYRRFISRLQIVGELDGHRSARVIADPAPQAFCAGYLRPKVYVSRRTVELLTPPELDAVLAHEHHHRRVRDPLRFAFGRVFGQALFFIPALRALSERYADEAELHADHAAVRETRGGVAALASALLVFEQSSAPGVAGISPERADSLLGQAASWRVPGRMLTRSVGMLSSIVLVVWQTSGIASAQASLNLPIVSSRPCIMVLAVLALGVWLAMALCRAGALEGLRRVPGVIVRG
ncbi:MAG TPA: M56 family metallopeptidase [Solirubrobacteraceae bacterium]|nr:M56 family metallopeptidase [Solirubrobacteraceae bacterium]